MSNDIQPGTLHAPRPASDVPVSHIDFYDDEVIADPYPVYRNMRNLGAIVHLAQHDLWAVTRYAEVRAVLRDFRTFSSAKGVGVDAEINALMSARNSLSSDPPLHDQMRKVTSAPLMPRALADVQPKIQEIADKLIDELLERKSFDGMGDLAQVLPLTVVSDLVGLPDYGRASMLKWAAATFNALGPKNERGRLARATLSELYEYCEKEAVPGKLKLQGWASRIYDAAVRGEIAIERCPGMMREYIGPSLDTTIFATGHLIRLLGENPDQWESVRNDPALIPGAITEALRIESPIRGFTRLATNDTVIDGQMVPANSRLLVMFASANRDERKWGDPDNYRVARKADDQVAFGHGIHTCAGMHLARMEMTALMNALVKRVKRIEVGAPTIAANNLLRGYDALPVTLH